MPHKGIESITVSERDSSKMWGHEWTRLFTHVSWAWPAETAGLETFQEKYEEKEQVTDCEDRKCDKPVSAFREIQYEHNAQWQDASDNQSDFIHEMISFSPLYYSRITDIGQNPMTMESDSQVPLL